MGNHVLDSHVSSGSQSGTVTGLTASTEYHILLFGYQSGVATTGLVSDTFTTDEDGNPEDLQFSFSFSDVTSSSLTVEIRPTPENALYFGALVSATFTEDDFKQYIEQVAQWYIQFGMATDVADFLKKSSQRGTVILPCDNLFSSTKYKMAVAGIYPDTGEYATDIVFSQVVTTEARTMSEATMNLLCYKYFNGDEIAGLYPEYSQGTGKAAVPVKAAPEGEVEEYYYTIYLNDMSDPDSYPDDAIIQDLKSYGVRSTPEAIFYCDYDTVVTIAGIAVGKDGYNSNVYRKVVTFDKAGCSPASEFEPLDLSTKADKNMHMPIDGKTAPVFRPEIRKQDSGQPSIFNAPADLGSRL